MNKNYIAGFFDGEGSAMILTVRMAKRIGTIYRFRPVIKIAQKELDILRGISKYLGYGHVTNYDHVLNGKRFSMGNFIVNGLDGVLQFVEDIAPYSELKKDALYVVKELAEFQKKVGNRYRSIPYTKEETIYMLDLRDRLFNLNKIRKARISQKYPREQILLETTFIEDTTTWLRERALASAATRKAILSPTITLNPKTKTFRQIARIGVSL